MVARGSRAHAYQQQQDCYHARSQALCELSPEEFEAVLNVGIQNEPVIRISEPVIGPIAHHVLGGSNKLTSQKRYAAITNQIRVGTCPDLCHVR